MIKLMQALFPLMSNYEVKKNFAHFLLTILMITQYTFYILPDGRYGWKLKISVLDSIFSFSFMILIQKKLLKAVQVVYWDFLYFGHYLNISNNPHIYAFIFKTMHVMNNLF